MYELTILSKSPPCLTRVVGILIPTNILFNNFLVIVDIFLIISAQFSRSSSSTRPFSGGPDFREFISCFRCSSRLLSFSRDVRYSGYLFKKLSNSKYNSLCIKNMHANFTSCFDHLIEFLLDNLSLNNELQLL